MTTTSKPSRLRKSAVAGGIAVLLLAGGGVTWSGWNQEQNVAGGTIAAGNLALSAPTTGTWMLYHATAADMSAYGSGVAVDPSSVTIVPGDKLEYVVEVTPTLVGDNLKATLAADTSGMSTSGLAPYVTVDGPVLSSGATTLTPADSGKAVSATTTIVFPFNSTTNQEGTTLTLDLTQLKLSLKQVL